MGPNGIPSDLLLTGVSGGSNPLRDHADPPTQVVTNDFQIFVFIFTAYLMCFPYIFSGFFSFPYSKSIPTFLISDFGMASLGFSEGRKYIAGYLGLISDG